MEEQDKNIIIEEVKLDSTNEKDNHNQIDSKGNLLRGKKKVINVPDKMVETKEIEEIREENQERTKNVSEKKEDKVSKCFCFIF